MIIFSWIAEFFLWLANVVTYFLPFLKPGNVITNHTEKASIVILSPSLTGPILYRREKKYFESRGFKTFVIDLAVDIKRADIAALKLQKTIDALSLDHICLVGVSAAGLVAYEYLNELNGWQHVMTFVAVATPFKGSRMAYFTYFDAAGRTLVPRSKYIGKIASLTPKHLDRTYCIVAKNDELVSRKSSVLPGAHLIELPVVGHVKLHAFSTKTFDTIIKIAKGEI